MTGPTERDRTIQRRSRQVGAVILAAFGLWVLVQFLGARYALPVRWVALADLAALAALAWAVIAAVGILRLKGKE